jgi:tetratricopeptide (TPR) repeat protein
MHGDRLRVNVGLVETASQLQVWSHRVDRTELDRYAIQDEIVKSLGRELQIEVVQLESERGTASPDLHELIFKGWAALEAASYSGVESPRQAERFFAQALSQNPNNLRAQAGLGAYHARMALQLHDDEPADHLEKAEAIFRRLIDRHPNSYGPYFNLGLVYVARKQARNAAGMFERVVELNPSHAPSYAQLGRTLVLLGRPDEGLEHILYAMRLSPRDPTLPYWLYFAGQAELERRDYGKAIVYAERAHALNPGHPHTMLLLAAAHALSDNMSAAHRQLDRLSQAKPHLSREKLIELYGEASGLRQSRFVEGVRRALAATL